MAETRILIVEAEKEFKIKIPVNARVTFGPWSPPNDKQRYNDDNGRRGTLRVYAGSGTDTIIYVKSGVYGFHDEMVEVLEKVASEVGATVWKNDEGGFERTEVLHRTEEWKETEPKALPPAKPKRKR